MFVAGVDVGSRSAKAVILENGKVVSYSICDTGPESAKSAEMCMKQAMDRLGLGLDQVEYVVGTGYGRVLIPFANENVSEISCHAKGMHWCSPSVRTILDMGGQDCKAIRCDEKGRVTTFIMNEKCAGGTGRFLEVIAEILDVPLEKIGREALESKDRIPFNTVCAVFAKSEAILLCRQGISRGAILAGLHEAIARRCYNLLKRVSVERDFAITGGIAKNVGMVAEIKKKVGVDPVLADEPQTIGALGAALFAKERAGSKAETKV